MSAISYAWGDAITIGTEAVVVNDEEVEAIMNLTEALWYLIDVNDPLRIDALCLDQTILEEKQQQIPLNADISASAAEVVVWLGPSNAAIDGLWLTMTTDNAWPHEVESAKPVAYWRERISSDSAGMAYAQLAGFLRAVAAGRVFFASIDRGTLLLGIGPASTKKGGVFVYFPGMAAPLLLGPERDY